MTALRLLWLLWQGYELYDGYAVADMLDKDELVIATDRVPTQCFSTFFPKTLHMISAMCKVHMCQPHVDKR